MSKKVKGTEDTLRKEWQKPKEQGYGPSAPQYPKGADPSKPGYSTRQTNLGAIQHLAKGAWTQKEKEQAMVRKRKEAQSAKGTTAKGAWTQKEKEAAMTRKREAAQTSKVTTAKGAWTQKEKEAAMRRKKEAAMAAKNKR